MAQKQTNKPNKKPIDRPSAVCTKKELSRQKTMQKLLDAGLDVFSKKGFDGASTKMVAQKAHVNEALLFRYFGDKEKFLTAIILNCIEASEKEFKDSPILEDLAADIRKYLFINYQQDLKNKAFIRTVIARSLVDTKMRKRILEQVPIRGTPQLFHRLQAHKKAGRIASHANEELMAQKLCMMAASLLFMAVTMEAMTKKEVEDAIDLNAQMFANFFGTQTL
jgi:AcrR family transcriptional regulator